MADIARRPLAAFLALAVLTPLAFASGVEALLLALLAAQFAAGMLVWDDPVCKVAFAFLLAVVYSGVSVAGLRLYDVVAFCSLAWWLASLRRGRRPRREHVAASAVLLAATVLVFVLAPSGYALVEVARIVASLGVFLLFASADGRGEGLPSVLAVAAAVAVFHSVAVLALMGASGANLDGAVLSTDVFFEEGELRLCGFFTDPNKYMSFLLVLLFCALGARFERKGALVAVLCVASVSTGSRSALISLALLAAVAVMRRLAARDRRYAVAVALAVAALAVAVVAIGPATVMQRLYVLSAQLMGRDAALQVSPTFMQDNRMLVYISSCGLIARQPLLGYGWDAMSLLPYPTHNTVLNVLMCGGVVLLAAYAAFLAPVARRLVRLRLLGFFATCVLVPMMLLDLFDYRLLFFLFGVLCSDALLFECPAAPTGPAPDGEGAGDGR